jgi:NitT/TauT family transport system permease protein
MPRTSGFISRIAVLAGSLAGMITLWWVVSVVYATPRIFPDPIVVFKLIGAEVESGRLPYHLWQTLKRVAAAFAAAMILGTIVGVILGTMPRLNRWAEPWVILSQNLPALVVIVLCYLWFGLNDISAIIAVSFNKTALVIVTLREGARAMDRKVAEMAKVFGMSPIQRLRHVVLPQLAPFLAASARNGLAIIWKLVLVVEFLGRSNGIGFQIHLYFQMFDVARVLAYSGAFIVVMLLIEYLLIQPIEAKATRWRQLQGGIAV